MKIYVGCSLTQAPNEFAEAVERVKDDLRSDNQVMDFLGLVKGTAADAYETDIRHNVATCDLFVAICDYPAIGLGMELGSAIEGFRKPVLALAQTDAKVTRMLPGVTAPGYKFARYGEMTDIPGLVRDYIKQLTP